MLPRNNSAHIEMQCFLLRIYFAVFLSSHLNLWIFRSNDLVSGGDRTREMVSNRKSLWGFSVIWSKTMPEGINTYGNRERIPGEYIRNRKT